MHMTTRSYQFNTHEHQRVLRFLVVGASGTALDVVLFLALKAMGVPTLAANILAYSAGIVNNFVWNRCWTFADARSKSLGTQFGQFALVSLIGLPLNSGMVLAVEALFVAMLGDTAWSYLPAKLMATGVSVAWNYGANRYWTFNDVR